MAISTDSIIHYTNTFDKLEHILKEGFGIKYCAEELKIEGEKGSLAAHPMISFCDIPLSQSYRHFDAYGKYGLGLTKVWANKMGINPVLYMELNSSISKTLGRLLVERRNRSKSNLTKLQRNDILKIKCFTKNYSGHLKREKIDNINYRFYDEREWRMVPEKDKLNGAKFSIGLKSYEKDKDKYNKLISDIRFRFSPNEISYIIVNQTIEIPIVINILRTEYSAKCKPHEFDILLSKIVSTEQIISDY